MSLGSLIYSEKILDHNLQEGTERELAKEAVFFFPQDFTAKTLGYYKWPKEARSRWFAYYPQSNGFAKVWNCEVKKVLEKTINTSWKDWSTNLMMHFRPTALPTR